MFKCLLENHSGTHADVHYFAAQQAQKIYDIHLKNKACEHEPRAVIQMPRGAGGSTFIVPYPLIECLKCGVSIKAEKWTAV